MSERKVASTGLAACAMSASFCDPCLKRSSIETSNVDRLNANYQAFCYQLFVLFMQMIFSCRLGTILCERIYPKRDKDIKVRHVEEPLTDN